MSAFKELIKDSWLDSLDDALLSELERKLEPLHLVPGELLFAQGDSGNCMYLVSQGRLEVLIRDPQGSEWLVNIVETADFVGEMALLTGQQRTATIRAAEASTLLRLTRTDFDALCSSYPQLLVELGEYAGPRMQNTQLIEILADLFGVLEMASLHQLRERLGGRLAGVGGAGSKVRG